jgi:outer membrane protein assembly factor BamB
MFSTLRSAPLVIGLAAATVIMAAPPAAAVEYRTQSTIDWAPNAVVYAVEVTADTVYIGGEFTSLRNVVTGDVVSRARLAAFDRQTGELLPDWTPSASSQVRTIEASADGQRIFVGGTFNQVDGLSRPRVAAITSAGEVVDDWRVQVDRRLFDLAVVGEHLYLAGVFTSVGNQSHIGIARVQASDATVDHAWDPSASDVRGITLAPNGSDLVLTGRFTTLNGANRRYLGSVRLDTGAVTGWAPVAECSACWHREVVADGDSVYVAGSGPAGRLVRYNATTGARVWRTTANGDVQSVEVFDGVVYGGGHFTALAGRERRFVGAVNASNGTVRPDLGLGLRDPDGGVWAISAELDALWLGGNYGHVGATQRARIAQFPAL